MISIKDKINECDENYLNDLIKNNDDYANIINLDEFSNEFSNEYAFEYNKYYYFFLQFYYVKVNKFEDFLIIYWRVFDKEIESCKYSFEKNYVYDYCESCHDCFNCNKYSYIIDDFMEIKMNKLYLYVKNILYEKYKINKDLNSRELYILYIIYNSESYFQSFRYYYDKCYSSNKLKIEFDRYLKKYDLLIKSDELLKAIYQKNEAYFNEINKIDWINNIDWRIFEFDNLDCIYDENNLYLTFFLYFHLKNNNNYIHNAYLKILKHAKKHKILNNFIFENHIEIDESDNYYYHCEQEMTMRIKYLILKRENNKLKDENLKLNALLNIDEYEKEFYA